MDTIATGQMPPGDSMRNRSAIGLIGNGNENLEDSADFSEKIAHEKVGGRVICVKNMIAVNLRGMG